MPDSRHPLQPLPAGERFPFACHPGVACFTECCRQLDLALTPYDVLRLRSSLKLSSGEFLQRYAIIEWEEGQAFPLLSLAMVDDGRASCVFVRENGCSVYADRPSSCRAYPVGRGAGQDGRGRILEQLVLVREDHCLGFDEGRTQTAAEYFSDQGVESYNRCNDELLPLVQHRQVQLGLFKPSRSQAEQYILALFDLDLFRRQLADGHISLTHPLSRRELVALAGDDEELLRLGIRWLIEEFFGA
jgi:Fe-S-cluster containining protein